MSDRVPYIIDVTVLHGTNTTVVRWDNPNLHCHYIQTEWYELGILKNKDYYLKKYWYNTGQRLLWSANAFINEIQIGYFDR